MARLSSIINNMAADHLAMGNTIGKTTSLYCDRAPSNGVGPFLPEQSRLSIVKIFLLLLKFFFFFFFLGGVLVLHTGSCVPGVEQMCVLVIRLPCHKILFICMCSLLSTLSKNSLFVVFVTIQIARSNEYNWPLISSSRSDKPVVLGDCGVSHSYDFQNMPRQRQSTIPVILVMCVGNTYWTIRVAGYNSRCDSTVPSDRTWLTDLRCLAQWAPNTKENKWCCYFPSTHNKNATTLFPRSNYVIFT